MLAHRIVLVSAVVLAVASCGSSSGPSNTPTGGGGTSGGSTTMAGQHGCTNVQGSCSSNNGLSCEEWAGYDAVSFSNFMKNCNHPNQVFSMDPCPQTNKVAGCEVAVNGVCDVIWSYPPTPASAVQTGCVGQSQMYVTP